VRVLVTGGCGFIGSNFIRYLLQTVPEVHILNLDALTYAGNPANLADLAGEARYRLVQGDVADPACVRPLLAEGVEAVFHFAAESHVDRSLRQPARFVRTNVLGTQVLLDAAKEYGVKRFIHISTDECYGSLGATGAFTEDSPLLPNNPYAASKAAADLLVRSYIYSFGLPAIITRCTNNYGPYQHPEKLIPLFITRLLRGEPVPLYGDGLQVRDWIHVRDHCAALVRIWRAGRPGQVYNIGARCERTNLEMAQLLCRLVGRPTHLIQHVADRPGHDRRYALDPSKLEQELSWRPTIPLEEGLRQTVGWYAAHTDWVAAVLARSAG
jgi:dTDP-glucose 4,6-dehydratase